MAILEGQRKSETLEQWKARKDKEFRDKLAPIHHEMVEAGFTEAQMAALMKFAALIAAEVVGKTSLFGGLGLF